MSPPLQGSNSDLIFLPDSLSHKVLKADSGASLSIVPYNSQTHPFGPKLRSASGASRVSKLCKSNLERAGSFIGFCWRRWLTQSWRWISSRNSTCSFLPPPPTRCSLHLPWTTSWMWILYRPPPLAHTSVSSPQGPPSPAYQPLVQQVGTMSLPSQVNKLLKGSVSRDF